MNIHQRVGSKVTVVLSKSPVILYVDLPVHYGKKSSLNEKLGNGFPACNSLNIFQLTDRLVKAIGNESTSTVFHLDTKYYQASVGVRQFRTGHDLLKFYKQEADVTIGAIVLK